MLSLLIIGGFDPSGKAGILLDARVASRLGVHPIAVPTALTFQTLKSNEGFKPVSEENFRKMLGLVSIESLDAVKIGMLGTVRIAMVVRAFLKRINVPVVLDPVLYSGDGKPLSEPGLVQKLRKIIRLCTVITPNISEASVLCDVAVNSGRFYETCWEKFVEMGAKNVLFKGGHADTETLVTDYLFSSGNRRSFRRKRLSVNIRGTGCALSTAIASFMSRGIPVNVAVASAEYQMSKWLSSAIDVGGQKILSI